MKINFYYMNGQVVSLGDRVLVGLNSYATVTKIIVPFSDEANEWGVPCGGALLDFDDSNCWLVSNFHEDFELVSRNVLVCDYPESLKCPKN